MFLRIWAKEYNILCFDLVDFLVDTQNSFAAGALVGHVLQVVDAAGDEGTWPEAGDAEHPSHQPGKQTHLWLGDGVDVGLAVGADHIRRVGVEEMWRAIDDHRQSVLFPPPSMRAWFFSSFVRHSSTLNSYLKP